jgi:hypothetical protein
MMDATVCVHSLVIEGSLASGLFGLRAHPHLALAGPGPRGFGEFGVLRAGGASFHAGLHVLHLLLGHPGNGKHALRLTRGLRCVSRLCWRCRLLGGGLTGLGILVGLGGLSQCDGASDRGEADNGEKGLTAHANTSEEKLGS